VSVAAEAEILRIQRNEATKLEAERAALIAETEGALSPEMIQSSTTLTNLLKRQPTVESLRGGAAESFYQSNLSDRDAEARLK
jgi:hypothetical protein